MCRDNPGFDFARVAKDISAIHVRSQPKWRGDANI
jgi:hypothetical protein